MVARKDRNESRAELHLPRERRVALVMGGSQGARNLNSLVIEAARQCADLCDFLIITGSADFARVSQLTADMPHVHVIEFCSAMATAYAAADVVISRSGASSLTELAHMGEGRPAGSLPLRRGRPPGAQRARLRGPRRGAHDA